jgi:hypothetical protein
MTGLEIVIIPIAQVIGYVVLSALANRRRNDRIARGEPVQMTPAAAAEAAKEDDMMRQLLGWTWKSRDIEWFATHTICRQCNQFFSTTDADDKCRTAPSGFHTYTPVLHGAVQRAVARAHRTRAPKIFLPGAKSGGDAVIKPPKPLESEWVMLDETDDNDALAADDDDDDVVDEEQFEREAREAVAQIEITPGAAVAAPADNIVPQRNP